MLTAGQGFATSTIWASFCISPRTPFVPQHRRFNPPRWRRDRSGRCAAAGRNRHSSVRAGVPMCAHSFKSGQNRASNSNDYPSNFVIPSLDSSSPPGFPYPTTPNSASHQPAFPYFLHSPPHPPRSYRRTRVNIGDFKCRLGCCGSAGVDRRTPRYRRPSVRSV